MAKSKESSTKEMEKMADNVAKKVLSSMNFEPTNGNGTGDAMAPDVKFAFGSDLNKEDTHEDYSEQLEDSISFDIFDHCDKIVKQGDQIKYEIRKNGEMLATKIHPYTWERLQKDYGAGSYQVTARSMVTRKYVKHETRPVANIDGSDTFHSKPEEVQPQQPQGPNFMEMFALMNNISEKSKAEARETAKDQTNASNGMMQGFIAMMQQNSTQAQQMFLEMSKLSMNAAEKMTEVTNRLFEKMEDRFEKIVEKLGKNKDDGMGALQLIKLTEDAQKKGFDMFDKISRIAEVKANEKIDMLEENRSHSSRSEKSSIVDRLVDNVLPTITNAINEQQKRESQMRRSLPPTMQRAFAPQAPRPRQQAPATTQPASNPQQNTQVQTNNQQLRTDNGQSSQSPSVRTNEFGLPTITSANAATIPPAVTKDDIEEILVPVIGKSLLKLDPIEVGAQEIIKSLQVNKISVKLFLDTFKKEDALLLVEKYSLPKEAVAWFEGVYANIETSS